MASNVAIKQANKEEDMKTLAEITSSFTVLRCWRFKKKTHINNKGKSGRLRNIDLPLQKNWKNSATNIKKGNIGRRGTYSKQECCKINSCIYCDHGVNRVQYFLVLVGLLWLFCLLFFGTSLSSSLGFSV